MTCKMNFRFERVIPYVFFVLVFFSGVYWENHSSTLNAQEFMQPSIEGIYSGSGNPNNLVRIPGIEKPLPETSKKVQSYFGSVVIMNLLIALVLLIALKSYINAVEKGSMDSIPKRIAITLLAGLFIGLVLVFAGYGCYWIFQVTFPPILSIGIIFALSWNLVLFFGLILTRNLFAGALISGTILTVISYLIFTGFKAFEHSRFSDFSGQLMLFLGAMIGFGLNIQFLRGETGR